MRTKINMWEFVPHNCEAMKEPEKFLEDWYRTESNPCSICSSDKSHCSYFKNLVERGIIDDEGGEP